MRPLLHRLGWIVSIPVTILVVLIAVMNRAPARLSLWPLPWDIEAPLFLLILGAILFGFLFGAGAMWVSGGVARRSLRATRRELDAIRLNATRAEAERRTRPAGSNPLPALPENRAALPPVV